MQLYIAHTALNENREYSFHYIHDKYTQLKGTVARDKSAIVLYISENARDTVFISRLILQVLLVLSTHTICWLSIWNYEIKVTYL